MVVRAVNPVAMGPQGGAVLARWASRPVDLAASFDELYREHFEFTARSLRHLGVGSEALPDACQEVWLVVHRRLSKFEGRSSYRTWLFSVALNTARHQRRTRMRQTRCLPMQDEPLAPGPDPDQALRGRELLGLVYAYLDTLNDSRRALFVCHLLEGLTSAESAEVLGLRVESVYHRARDLRRGFRLWLARRRAVGEEGS